MKLQICAVDFNPWVKLIWVARRPSPLPQNYTGGWRWRQYRLTPRRVFALFDACQSAGLQWSQDGNGTHFKTL